jgi:hypothetical protein
MEENFSPQDSLELIRSMISKTRANMGENKVYFLLWGWVTFAAIVSQFILKVVLRNERHYLVWLVVIPTVIINIIYATRRRNRPAVRTYVSESMGYLWTGVGISFFVLSVIISSRPAGWMDAWPLFILFYGLGTFVSGKILQFKPLIMGGIFNWMLALASIFVAFDYQLLLAAAAILTSYIIPGHLLGSYKRN